MGRKRARVRVCQDPLLGGIGEALKTERIREVIDQHRGMTDVFILCVDRDGEPGRRIRLDEIERRCGADCVLLAENAWGRDRDVGFGGTAPAIGLELGRRAGRSGRQGDVLQTACKAARVADGPGGGRKALGEEAASSLDGVRRKCPDDFDALAKRLETAVAGSHE